MYKVFTIIDCCYIFYRLNPLSLDYLFEPLGKCSANKQSGWPGNLPGLVTNEATEEPGAGG